MTTATTSQMFRFALLPLDDIQPWGEPESLSLHWFALTDGHYMLRIGDQEILRYDDAACESLNWSLSGPDGFANTVSYQVARLFEDVAEILPSVISEVPADVAAVLDTVDSQVRWEQLLGERDHADSDAESLFWVDARTLDCGHLRQGPQITLWRVADTIRIRCDNRSRRIDGVPIWSCGLVEAQLPLAQFLDEVHQFGKDLLTQMDERVRIVESGWKRAGVRLEPLELREQHQQQVTFWTHALRAEPRPSDWDLVRHAMQRG